MEIIIDNQFKTQLSVAILTSPIIYIPSYHYAYIDLAICEILLSEERSHDLFNITNDDICEYDLSQEKEISFCGNNDDESLDLIELLRQISNGTILNKKKIFLIKGIARSLQETDVQVALMRFASNYETFSPENKCITLILVDAIPISLLPETIIQILQYIEIPLPDTDAISNIVKQIPISKSVLDYVDLQQKVTHCLKGMDLYQICKVLDNALIKTGGLLTYKILYYAQQEKIQIVKKTGVLDVVVSDIKLDMIGGLDVLRGDIKKKAKIFRNLDFSLSKKARIVLPKGILILGMPGCGKSMIAKAISNEFSMPLLRLDIGRLMGQYVGLSEENLRKALAVVEATNPCVLWIDEIEKAFAGSQNKGGNEDSLIVRLLGTFLTWMQERTTPIYIVATANDVMRPEFMRKGRFDEIYFVDFPLQSEREQILRKKIGRFIQKESGVDSIYNFQELEKVIPKVASRMVSDEISNYSNGFSGAEIEFVVNAVIEKKFLAYLEYFGCRSDGVIDITEEDFDEVVKIVKNSVMAGQKGTPSQPSSIQRIRDIQTYYNFKNASNLR